MLREGFDVEGTSQGWSIDIQPLPQPGLAKSSTDGARESDTSGPLDEASSQNESQGSVLSFYETTVLDPTASLKAKRAAKPSLEITAQSHQDFLASQLAALEALKAEDEKASASDQSQDPAPQSTDSSHLRTLEPSSRLNAQVGPVQFNVGGIQADTTTTAPTDAASQRSNSKSPVGDTPTKHVPRVGADGSPATPDGKSQNEQLSAFFKGLMDRGRNSPRTPGGRERSAN